eukprot:COSAG06_NODE_37421_length_435_cov_1.050595_2_plen_58_part_01
MASRTDVFAWCSAPEQPKVSRQFGPQTWSDFQLARDKRAEGGISSVSRPIGTRQSSGL